MYLYYTIGLYNSPCGNGRIRQYTYSEPDTTDIAISDFICLIYIMPYVARPYRDVILLPVSVHRSDRDGNTDVTDNPFLENKRAHVCNRRIDRRSIRLFIPRRHHAFRALFGYMSHRRSIGLVADAAQSPHTIANMLRMATRILHHISFMADSDADIISGLFTYKNTQIS